MRSKSRAREEMYTVHLQYSIVNNAHVSYVPAGPHVDRRAIALAAEQQFGRPIPESDHFVRVWPVLQLSVPNAREPEIGELQGAAQSETWSRR